eukprot:Gb_09446 [translate_table: standard]
MPWHSSITAWNTSRNNIKLAPLPENEGNPVFEEVVFPKFAFKEDFQVLETPIKSFVDSSRKPITPKAKNLILQHLMAHHNPPPPPPRVNRWVQAKYGPLRTPVNVHDMPDNYLKILPKFDGEKNALAEDHMTAFQDFTDNLFIEHDDVYMRFFVQTLEGDVKKWFRDLTTNSIDSWETFKVSFMRQWGKKRDHLYYLTEFGALKKKNSESVLDFNKRFNKLYNKIHIDNKPSQAAAKVTYGSAFDLDFAMILRERRPQTLYNMQDDVVDIEGNMTASRKIKPRSDSGEKDKKKQKEEGVGNSNNAPKLPQNLGARNFNPPSSNPNPNPFRRPYNPPPQILARDTRNKEQHIQPPLRNNNMMIEYNPFGEAHSEQCDEKNVQDDMNWMNDEVEATHLTQADYEESLCFYHYFLEEDPNEQEELLSSQYRLFPNSLQAELHKKKVKCIGMIKDLVATLGQIYMKNIMMDVVVADVPATYRMLLSRSWGAKLRGTLQLDMTYATVPFFGGETRRLYRETKFTYALSNSKNPKNFHVYTEDDGMGCCILSIHSEDDHVPPLEETLLDDKAVCIVVEGIWKLYFDGTSSREGSGAGVVLIPPIGENCIIRGSLTRLSKSSSSIVGLTTWVLRILAYFTHSISSFSFHDLRSNIHGA